MLPRDATFFSHLDSFRYTPNLPPPCLQGSCRVDSVYCRVVTWRVAKASGRSRRSTDPGPGAFFGSNPTIGA